MTTLDISDQLVAPRKPGLFARLSAAMRRNFERRARYRALISLSGYDAYLLRDIGIDSRDIEDALNGRYSSPLLEPIR
ncbi:MAG TPA: hypothetical protein VIN06_18340, partial [Devosia sp.]